MLRIVELQLLGDVSLPQMKLTELPASHSDCCQYCVWEGDVASVLEAELIRLASYSQGSQQLSTKVWYKDLRLIHYVQYRTGVSKSRLTNGKLHFWQLLSSLFVRHLPLVNSNHEPIIGGHHINIRCPAAIVDVHDCQQ